jgi:hypothetical protein
VTKRWKDSLPPTLKDREPERRAEMVIRYSVEAMSCLRQDDLKTAMLMVRIAAAETRAWRKSLSKQGKRVNNGRRDYLDNRELLRIVVRSIALADMRGPQAAPNLRAAEAALWLLGRRLIERGQT